MYCSLAMIAQDCRCHWLERHRQRSRGWTEGVSRSKQTDGGYANLCREVHVQWPISGVLGPTAAWNCWPQATHLPVTEWEELQVFPIPATPYLRCHAAQAGSHATACLYPPRNPRSGNQTQGERSSNYLSTHKESQTCWSCPLKLVTL